MTTRIGIHLSRDAICGVVVSDGRVTAIASCDRGLDTVLRDQLESLFESLPPISGKVRIVVALDPPAAWMKCITGLAAIQDGRVRQQAVRENADQYFLGDVGSRVLALMDRSGNVVADSYDRQVVGELRDAISRARAREVRVISASALAPDTSGGIGPAFGVAKAATAFDPRTAPSLSLHEQADMTPLWRRRAALAAMTVAAAFLVLSPTIRWRRIAAGARTEINGVASSYRVAAAAIREVDRANAKLNYLETARGPVRVTALMAQITKELPRDAAMIAFSYDTTKGSAVVLSPSVVNVLPALDDVLGIGSVKLSGPITRERHGDRDLERATMLMTWRANE